MPEELELLLSSSEDIVAGDDSDIYGDSETYTYTQSSSNEDSGRMHWFSDIMWYIIGITIFFILKSMIVINIHSSSWSDQLDIKYIPFSKTQRLLVQSAENELPIHCSLIADGYFFYFVIGLN